MKRLISMLMVLVLLCSVAIPAFAASENADEYLSSHLDCKAEHIYPGARVTLYADYFTDGAVPSGDTIKFQWYKNSVNSNQSGTKIELSEGNSQGNAYIPDASQVGTMYYYAVMTYTTSGGNVTQYRSDAIKVTVEANPGTHVLTNLLTPAEASGWMETTSSQDLLDFYNTIAAASGGRIRMESGGTTAQGRVIPIMIMGTPAPAGPEDVPEDKAIVYFNVGIHSGECESKEAMMIFAREAAMGLHDDLLENLVIVSTVNHSPDGNDALGYNRNNTQYTPKRVGARTNAQGGSSYYNINRDMTKLDTAEGRALVAALNKWDPIAYVDMHGTNGTLQRHGMETHSGLHPDQYQPLALYNRDDFTELALGSKSYFFEETGWVTAPYGDFRTADGGYTDGGTWWVGSESFPRFTTNYIGMRNRISVLFEAYSHDPYTVRVDIEYYGILSFLKAADQEKDTIKQLIADADAASVNRAVNGLDPEKDVVSLIAERTILDRGDGKNGTVNILSYNATATGGVINYVLRDDEGHRSGTMYSGLKEYTEVKHYGAFKATDTVPLGAYYLIEQDCTEAIELLKTHGIEMFQLTAPVTLDAGEYQWYKATGRTRTNSENHSMNQLSGSWEVTDKQQTFPAGTYVVSSAQVLGSLAAYMMEPGSPDGIVAWNVVDDQMESYAGTVRADYTSTLAGGTIAVPVFKLASYDLLDVGIRIKVETDANLVEPGDSFRVNSAFTREVNSNTAVLTYTFDTSKFTYQGFTPSAGLELLDVVNTDNGVKLTVMIQGYNAKDLGELLFTVKEDANLANEIHEIKLSAEFVVKDESDQKQVYTTESGTTFTSRGPIGEVTLIDLSNLIDKFGMTSNDPEWNEYRFFDFNNSGTIDVYDISTLAKLIK